MIVKNRLLDLDYCIYQNEDWFKFSLDSVLLSYFVTIHLKTKRIMDLGTGNAPIPMFLSLRTNAMIYGVEYQKCIYDLAVLNIEENNLKDRVHLICDDVRVLHKKFDSDSFDVVLCNPPYFKVSGKSYLNDNDIKTKARHEISLNLDDVVSCASYLLKNGGFFAMVHRTERLVEIIEKFKEYRIEPKRIQFIYPKSGMNSDLFLIEGVKNGNPGLKMLSPIVVHKEDGEYTDEVQRILSFTDEG